jgi:hypothetical protein
MNARRHVEQFGSLLHPALAVRAAGGVGNARGIPCAVVTGTGFRMPGPDLGVHIYADRSAGPVALDITSTDPSVFVWKDVQIVRTLPPDLTGARDALGMKMLARH